MNFQGLKSNLLHSAKVSAGFSSFFRRMLWLYGNKPIARAWRGGVIRFRYPKPVGRLQVAVRNNRGSDAFIMGEVFDHQYYQLPLSNTPETILDLGANIGLVAIYYSRIFPNARIACVEPMPGNLDYLRRNLKLNRVAAEVFASAVAVSDGTVVMAIHPTDCGHHVLSEGSTANQQSRQLTVPALSIPTILKQLGWPEIGLLKVDIEGYETVLLEQDCDWLRQVKAICIEWHDELGEVTLRRIADRWGFGEPKLLPGIWFMERKDSVSA